MKTEKKHTAKRTLTDIASYKSNILKGILCDILGATHNLFAKSINVPVPITNCDGKMNKDKSVRCYYDQFK